MAKTYTVKQGDTIQDAAFNVSGSLAGIDPILEKNTPTNIPPADWKAMQYRQEPPAKNFMESYTPALRTNQILDVEGIDDEHVTLGGSLDVDAPREGRGGGGNLASLQSYG